MPLYTQADYPCPNEFIPYRNTCLYPDVRQLPYDEARKTCATKGALILPIKDKEIHLFVASWGPSSGKLLICNINYIAALMQCVSVRGDVWVGLKKQKHEQFYDSDPTLLQPLQELVTNELTYSDGISFNSDVDYMYGTRKLNFDCFYLKQSADFEIRGGSCIKEKGFICEWQGR
jgi:hypothetical protein